MKNIARFLALKILACMGYIFVAKVICCSQLSTWLSCLYFLHLQGAAFPLSVPSHCLSRDFQSGDVIINVVHTHKLLGLGRQIGQIKFGVFGVFSANL